MNRHPDPGQNLARLFAILRQAEILPFDAPPLATMYEAGYLVLAEWLESEGFSLTELILTVKRFKEIWHPDAQEDRPTPTVTLIRGSSPFGVMVMFFKDDQSYVPTIDLWVETDTVPVTAHTFDVLRCVALTKPQQLLRSGE